ncbi:MAG: DEAD/DEAH box helicase [Geobacteraceae bacterium]|nr:DEAD/DEAH box helicase [Geobacteraceae bacterium]
MKTSKTPKKRPGSRSAESATTIKPPKQAKLSRTHKPEDMTLEEWQRQLRMEYGESQEFLLENRGEHPVFSEFALTNPVSNKTYRIAIRGDQAGDNFCSCPDFRINGLGVCKHISFTLARLKAGKGGVRHFNQGFNQTWSEIYLSYGLKREVRLRLGSTAAPPLRRLAQRYFAADGVLKGQHIGDITDFITKATSLPGHELRCYDDVMAFIASRQDAVHRQALIDEAFPTGIDAPLFDSLIKASLYPYQREGILFASRAGRSLLADDMGLGKTVQAIAVAEVMARLFGVAKVLVVSPTSLKHQWKGEIDSFTDRTATVIEGLTPQRRELYRSDSFFKLVNYELIYRDAELIEAWAPDLIVLDEAQRIKNWQTRTAQAVKRLESPFALVLTGTPLENRIEELHSIMEFVDRHHLGPLYRFVHAHRVTDHAGKLVGYKELDKIRASLNGVMIRRKKSQVLKQLPERIDKNFFVPMTPEQMAIHQDYADMVARLVNKWRRFRFLSEADSLRLRIALANMRMVSDNTWLVDKKTVHGPKLGELETLLRELVVEGGEKVVIFSQWLRMNELVEQVLERLEIGHVHLNGSVPSKNRKHLMSRFKSDPACKVFLSTDAGGVGLNLQSGAVVINLDIPWNPAILEQRIARVHRMGQKKPVRVINFISCNSIEERILDLLRFKKAVFAGALDEDGRDTVMIGESQLESFMNSVENLTGSIERADLSGGQELWRDEQDAEEAGDEIVAVVAEDGSDECISSKAIKPGGAAVTPQLSELLQTGARFLMELGQALAPQSEVVERAAGITSGETPRTNPLSGLVAVDEATGKSCLKIPLPEPEVMTTLFSGLSQLLAGYITGRK